VDSVCHCLVEFSVQQ